MQLYWAAPTSNLPAKEHFSSSHKKNNKNRPGIYPVRKKSRLCSGSDPEVKAKQAWRMHTWVCALPRPPSVFALAQCPFTPPSTPHTVWHLNPANGIISPGGQFSRMENRLSLLHQIAAQLCWHQHCFLTPYCCLSV